MTLRNPLSIERFKFSVKCNVKVFVEFQDFS